MKIVISVGRAGRSCLQLLRCGLVGSISTNGGTGFNLSPAGYQLTSCQPPFGPDSPARRAFAMQPPAEPPSPGK